MTNEYGLSMALTNYLIDEYKKLSDKLDTFEIEQQKLEHTIFNSENKLGEIKRQASITRTLMSEMSMKFKFIERGL